MLRPMILGAALLAACAQSPARQAAVPTAAAVLAPVQARPLEVGPPTIVGASPLPFPICMSTWTPQRAAYVGSIIACARICAVRSEEWAEQARAYAEASFRLINGNCFPSPGGEASVRELRAAIAERERRQRVVFDLGDRVLCDCDEALADVRLLDANIVDDARRRR